MNKNYRTIWNDALGAWVAVSEIETAKGKPAGSIVNTLNFRYISETINQYHPFDFSAGFF